MRTFDGALTTHWYLIRDRGGAFAPLGHKHPINAFALPKIQQNVSVCPPVQDYILCCKVMQAKNHVLRTEEHTCMLICLKLDRAGQCRGTR